MCKYYGHKLTSYLSHPLDSGTLSSNFANTIVEDPRGNVWVATDNGLNRYHRETDKFLRYYHKESDENSLSDNKVNALFVDSQGTLWAGTHRGLSRYDGEQDSFRQYLSLPGIQFSNNFIVNDIYEDNSGVLWLGSHAGLIRFNPSTEMGVLYTQESAGGRKLAHNQVNAVEGDETGRLWVGTHRGISTFDPQNEQFGSFHFNEGLDQELKDEGISAILNDETGALWVGTYTMGILKIDPETTQYSRIVKTETLRNGLASDHIRCIFKDRNGLLWIGAKFEGIFIHDLNKTIFSKWPPSFETFRDIKDKHVMNVYPDPKQKDVYWIATKFDGLYRVNAERQTAQNYRPQPGNRKSISSVRVHATLRDREGGLYVGSEEGLQKLEEESGTFIHLSHEPILTMIEDSRGVLWTGSYKGVYYYSKSDRKLRRWPSRHPFFSSSIDIKYLYESTDGKLWITTENSGAYRYDPATDSLDTYTHQPGDRESLSSNMARPVFEDSKGRIWIGTKDNGLNLYDQETGKFRHFTMLDGLPTNFILNIEEDPGGNLWMGTHNGLVKFDPEHETFTNYNRDYGLRNNIFELAASCNMGNGHLFFGGHNGFNIFHADSISQKQTESKLLVSSVKVMGNEILRDLNESTSLSLQYDENYLSIEYLLTDYSNPGKHQFSYMMEGLDRDRNYAGNRNQVSYSSLAPGEYTLKIRGANEFGIWNREAFQLNIIIQPPYYATWWFRSLVAFILIASGLLMYISKTIRNKRDKRILEEKIKERTQELQKALRELREQQEKIEIQNGELTSQYQKIVSQRDEIQDINHQLSHAHSELKEINRTLDERVKERTERLIKTNQELDRFVYSASHDLSAPLKSILGLINIAKYENKDKSLANNLEYMERSVRKLEDVIKSLTQFSRNMGHKLKKANIVFNDIVDDVVNEARMAYNCSDAQISKHYQNGALIYTDYMRLRIILTNLVGNAFKYRKEDEKLEVQISLTKIEDHYLIKIRDNGIGIAKEDQESVFSMFFRATEQSEGSGLGLYIVSETLDKLQGNIALASEPGQFTEFTVQIPVITTI